MNARIRADYLRARRVRDLLADVYGAVPSHAVFLAPGTLAGLRLVFDALRVSRVALSADEYFGRSCFPTARADLVRPDALAAHVVRHRPDAVVLSIVTWRGERIPLESSFREIRARLGADAPLLVADLAHAGAAGFRRVAATHADIVVGDATKWMTPPWWPDRLGYLWFRPAALRGVARRVFAPFYLAGVRPGSALEARWVDPEAVASIAAWLGRSRITRRTLLARYASDLRLATAIAERCGAPVPPTPLVWLAKRAAIRKIPRWVRDSGLLWRPPGGGVRIMCRSDVASAGTPGAAGGRSQGGASPPTR